MKTIVLVYALASSAAAFDISEELFLPGDLPATWKAEPMQPPPKMFETLPETEEKADRRLSRAGKVKGGVTAFDYTSVDDAAIAYDTLLEGMGSDTEVVEGLGDQSRSFTSVTKYPPAAKMPDFHRSGILFIRGNTVVQISLSDLKAEEIAPFAKKIDARIQQHKASK